MKPYCHMGDMCLGCSPQLIEGICPDSKAGMIVAELVQVLQEIVRKDLLAGAIKHDASAAISKVTGGEG